MRLPFSGGAGAFVLLAFVMGLLAAAQTTSASSRDPYSTVSITGGSVNENAGTMKFKVTLNEPDSRDTSVNYATSDGTAKAGSDYGAVTSTRLSFAAHETEKEISVPITNDTLDENDETFTVILSSPTNLVLGTASGTGTIKDDDSLPSLSITGDSVFESAAAGKVVFTVALNPASGRRVTVNYATSGGSATQGVDYTAASGTLTFNAGDRSKTIEVPIVGDTVDEDDETFTVTLSGASNASLPANPSAAGTILDDDTAEFSVADVSVLEGAASGNMEFTVVLSASSDRRMTVDYSTTAGTATEGADYTAVSGTLEFAVGDTEEKILVPVVDDALDEPDETFTLTLSNASNAANIGGPVGAVGSGDGGDDLFGPGSGSAVDTAAGTIRDDDEQPSLSISSPSVTEGDSGSATLTFKVTLSAASGREVTVGYADAGTGTAASGTDYTAITAGTLTFAAGDTGKDITVTVRGDALDEADETVEVTISSAVNASISTASGTGTIKDDDSLPSLSITGDSVFESAAAGKVVFTVALNPASGRRVTVNYATSGGSATQGVDYTAASGTLTFNAGDRSKTIEVPIVGDTVDEDDETFTVTLSGASNASLPANPSAAGTILDDDTAEFSVADVSVLEGAASGNMEFTVVLSASSDRRMTVDYSTTAGTATEGADYTAVSGTLEFAVGDTEEKILVPVVDDALDEPDETFTLTLSNASNAANIGGPVGAVGSGDGGDDLFGPGSGSAVDTAAGTIRDDDEQPSLSISSPSVTEGDSGSATLTFKVALSAASGREVTVGYADAGTGTAASGTDYTAITAGTLTFAAGDTGKDITVTVRGDALDEADETVEVTISSAVNASISTASGTGTIKDDDSLPSLSITGDSVFESAAAGKVVFTVALNPASGRRVTVNYATSGGSATQGVDYTAASGTLTFNAGDRSKTIEVPIVGDTVDEDDETFTVTLSGASNASLPANPSAAGTILDDDTAEFSVADVSVLEGAASGNMEFTVVLSASSDRRMTVDYSTTAGTATEGADYTAVSGTLEFAVGDTEEKILVPVVDDALDEPDETFTLTLSNASNAANIGGPVGAVGSGDGGDDLFGPGSGSAVDTAAGTIRDDDEQPSLSISSPSVTEGDSGSATLTFKVTLSAASGREVTVGYADAGTGTAASGTDYTAITAGTLTFAAGDTGKDITVTVRGDALDEADETVEVTISSAVNASISTASGTGTIKDDDSLPSLSITGDSVFESAAAGKVVFTVALNPASGRRVTVNYATSGGSATQGVDYTAASGTLTFNAGDRSKTIEVPIVGDTVDEDDETFTVTLSGASNASLPANPSAAGTILDDDTAEFSVADVSVLEGAASGNMEFTVVLSASSDRRMTVDYSTTAGTATEGADYTAVSGTLEFAVGDTEEKILVPVVDDALDEPDETFTLTLSNASNAANIGGPVGAVGSGDGGDDLFGPGSGSAVDTAAGTIRDDDEQPSLSISSPSVTEGDSGSATLTFKVALSAASGREVTVGYADAGTGTATSGTDYTAITAGTLTFAAGDTGKDITVTVRGDALDEADETVEVTISSATNASISTASGTGTIKDDDSLPTVSMSAATASVGESAGTKDLTVSLSAVSSRDVTVLYTVSSKSGDTATAADDYTEVTSGSLTITAGDTSGTITVTVVSDTLDEADETFTVTLGTPTNAALGSTTKTVVTITDDDSQPAVSMSAATASVGESDGTKELTVSLSGASGRNVTLPYTVTSASGDTATATDDYAEVTSGSLTVTAGDTSGTITVTVVSDTLDEADETFTVTLGTPTNAALGSATKTVVTITDDDAQPSLSISSPSVTEGDSGSATLTFKVTLSAASGREVTVGYADAGTGTATSGTDYAALSSDTLTFAAGDTSKDVTVTVNGDSLNEPNETVEVTISSAVNASISTATGTGTITDDDSQPTVSMSAATASVGESDGTKELTVSLSGASGRNVTLPYTVTSASGDTATATDDYAEVTSGSLTVTAGDTSGTITVTVVSDTLDEADETFTVTLGTPTNAALGSATKTVVTITDDDAQPSLSISSPSVTEGDSGSATLTFKVTLSAASGREVTVGYADAGTGTATSGTDYAALSSDTLTFAAGDTSKDVAVTVNGDSLNEPNETVEVTISSATNASISTATGTGTITDDDSQPTVSMSAATASVGESDGTKELTVSLSGASGRNVTLPYTVTSASGDTATATDDYAEVTSGSLTVTAGDTSGTITVTVVSDTLDEADETFTVTLGTPTNAALGSATKTVVTITDDDAQPSLSISSPSVTEGDSGSATLTFKVTLSAASGREVTVGYADAGTGTATSGTDYAALSSDTLTFAAGDTSKDVTVTVNGDSLNEPNETVEVTISSAVNASISTATGTGTITDDDSQPTVSMSAATASVGESDGTKELTVSLSAASGRDVAVPYTVTSASGDTATATDDYAEVTSGSLTVTAGDTSGTITVTVVSDTLDEADETFTVTLGAPTNAALGSAAKTVVTITDDDAQPSLSISSPSVTEGDSGSATLTFKVTLSAASGREVTVGYADAGTGTATSGTDYAALSSDTLTFAAGDTSKDVTVTVNGDSLNEADETVEVTISSATNASISTATGTGTITDDDSQPTVSMSAATASVGESDGTKELTVSLSGASGRNVTLPYTVTSASGDTATATDDYAEVTSGSLTVTAGDTSGTITVTVVSDTLDEADETFTVTLGTPTNAALGSATKTVVTITDDDAQPSLSISSPSVTEGDSGSATLTFKVTLSAASGREVTVGYADAGTGTATSGTDYAALSSDTLTFAAGDTSKDVAVTVNGDSLNEPNETVEVTISSATNASISTATGTGTITDDDSQPAVTMSAATASVGESDGTKELTVSLSTASGRDVAVPYTVTSASGDTATATDDYTEVTSGSLTVTAGDTSGTITVTVVSDTLDEADETFTVTLGTPTNAALGSATKTVVTITDDDAQPSLSISSPSVTEGDSGSATLTFKVTLSAASGREVTVGYADAGTGTATSGTDYAALSSDTLTFAAGDTSKDVTVTVNGDSLNEPNETVEVTISSAVNASISTATGTGTITDDDSQPTVSMSAATASVGESDGTKELTVSLSAASGRDVAVPYTVTSASGDTATATDDYAEVTSGSLTVTAGDTSGTITVTVVSDTLDEADETFTVTLGAPTNAALGSAAKTVVTITDDDAQPSLSISSPSVTEGDSGSATLTFKVTLSAASGREVTVGYADAGTGTATSGTDYAALSSDTLTFAAGDTSKDVTVTVNGDSLNEPNETVEVTISSATNASISTATGTGTITDDDSQPTVSMSAATASVGESDGTKELTVSLAAASGRDVAVPYTVTSASGDTATATDDYAEVTSGSLTITAGDTSGTITVTVVSDTLDEADETFTVTLGTPTNAALGSAIKTVVTITDDDAQPALSISSPSVVEGAAGSTTTLTFTVTLSAASGREVTVGYADTGTGTATSGTDYATITSGTLTFTAGDTSKNIDVTVMGDSLDEADETIDVKISSAVNASISTGTGTGTIEDPMAVVDLPPNEGVIGDINVVVPDNNIKPMLSISSPSVTEGDSGSVTLTFKVTLSAASDEEVTVDYADAGTGTATSGTDYAALSSDTLTFAAGDTSKDVAVTVNGDSLNEPNETVEVTISSAVNASISTATGTGTITDDDSQPTVSMSAATASVGESDGTKDLTVSLSAASGRDVAVPYTVTSASGDTATATDDYAEVTSGSLTITAGGTSGTITVTVVSDTLDEADETFTVTLGTPTNAALGSTAKTVVTITDDDAQPSLSISSPSVTEGDSGSATLTFKVTLSAASGREVTVSYADAGTGTATSGTDYAALSSGTLTFAAGDTSKDVAVTVNGDSLNEPNETVEVTISSAVNASISTATGTGTITDDDSQPTVSMSAATASVGESDGTKDLTVSLSAASGRDVTVPYTVTSASGDTATATDDYAEVTSGSLTVTAGDTSGTITVTVVSDTLDEADETFTVTLGAPTNAALGSAAKTVVTITDDDAQPSLSISSPSVTEGDSGSATLTFKVTLSAASGREVTVDYADAGTGTATSGTDYAALSSDTLTFAAGDTSKDVAVTVNGDSLNEPNETVEVTISSAVNASISTATGTGTITDDDSQPTVSMSAATASVGESDGTKDLTVSLSAASGRDVTVPYTVTSASGDTASASDDYAEVTSGSLTVTAGGTSGTITVTVVSDTLDEADETFTVTLGAPTNAALGSAAKTVVTITDDDAQPSLSISSPSVTEGDSGSATLTFKVTLSAASGREVTVDYADAGTGTATSGTDYAALSSDTLTFAAGDTSKDVAVTVNGDSLNEPNETVEVTISSATNASISTATGTGTITDDDSQPTVTMSAATASVGESDGTKDLTVSLSAISSRDVTVLYTVSSKSGDTATATDDYAEVTSGSLTITAGGTSGTITVTVVSDTLDEADETFTVTLSSPTNASLGSATKTVVTITDDDAQPALSISSPSVVEGAAGSTTTLTFTVTLSAASGREVTVGYADAGTGTATSGTDYATITSGTLTFTAGDTSKNIDVTVMGDSLDEADETIDVKISSAVNASISTGTGTGTIEDPMAVVDLPPNEGVIGDINVVVPDNNIKPMLSISSPSVTEGDSGSVTLMFKVTLSAASDEEVTVDYADAGTGTATSGTDYAALSSGTLTFAAGDTSKDVAVTVNGDSLNEPNETVEVTISSAVNASISTATGTGTITDDDSQPTVSMSAATASVGESDGTKELTVSLSAASGRDVAVPYTVTSASGDTATASDDYTEVTSGSLTVTAGGTSGTITVTVVSDTLDEADETFTVTLGTPTNAALGSAAKTVVTITDDDAQPSLSISSPSVTEGDSGSATLTFKVTLSAASDREVTVDYADAGTGTATSGTDYAALSSDTLTFAAGDTSKDVAVTVNGDSLNEPNETVEVTISSATNASISTATGTGTITDDDSQPTVSMSAATASVGESDGTKELTVSLSAASGRDVAVPYTVTSASGDTATATDDYAEVTSGSLTITAGDTSGTITVTVVSDTLDEADETFTVTLGTPTNAALGSAAKTVVTIRDDDAQPALSISSPSVTEGDSGSATLTFKVTLSAASGREVTVDYADAGTGTATSGTDYAALSSDTLTFAAGDTSKDVAVTVNGDSLNEPNETVEVTISSATNASISTATGTGTITDDDSQPTVSMSAATASVGESDGTKDLTVSLSAISSRDVTVLYTVSSKSGDTATASDDYTEVTSGSLTVTAGGTSGTITVTVVSDTLDEADETFTVTLGTPTNAALGSAAKTVVTITDDDAQPSLSISSPSVTEGDSGSATLTFKVTLSAASDREVTVDYADAGTGTATSGTDYAALSSDTLTFAAGDTSKDVAVTVNGDSLNEPNETVEVTISSATNASISTATGTGTITDDDSQPTVSMSAATASVGESDGTKELTVSLSAASGRDVAVPYTVTSASGDTASASDDYTEVTSGNLTVTAGGTSGTITVTVVSDTLDEADETFTVTLGTPTNAALGSAAKTVVTITDDDAQPSLSISSPSVTEGDSGSATLTFKVTLSAASGREVTVGYADAGTGTATSGTDYAALSSDTLTFAAGDTSKDVAVTVNGDSLNEPNETVEVTISSATNASISTATGTGTITDDDSQPTVSMSAATASVGESDGTKELTVSLSAASGRDVAVPYTVTSASGDTATASDDYTEVTSGNLTVTAGGTSGTITVTVVSDTLDEADETFTVTLGTPTNAALGSAAKTVVTITDDDAQPSLSISSPSVTEGDSGSATLTFKVTLSAASGREVTVDYADAGTGTATSGTDYAALSSDTLTFAAGDTSKDVAVTVNGDSLNEPNETVEVTISSATNASISTATGTGTITDDDSQPTVSMSAATASVGESDGTKELTISLSTASGRNVTLPYTVTSASGDTATASDDYTEVTSGSLTITAGDTSGTITVTVVSDTLDEADETFTVALGAPTNAALGSATKTVVTITDDDRSVLSEPLVLTGLSVGDVNVAENISGGKAKFTIRLTSTSTQKITVDCATSDGTAKAGSDYVATSETLAFAAGETEKTFSVDITNDILIEPNETFTVTLSNPTGGATINDGTATGTIEDDDFSSSPSSIDIDTPRLSIADASVAEDVTGGRMNFTVTLSEASERDISVNYETTDGSATEGTDYVATSGTLTIVAGNTKAKIAVPITDDDLPEADETFTVTISDPSNAILETETATGTIVNDDTLSSIAIEDSDPVAESDTGDTTEAVFTVTLSPANGRMVTVNYTTADGTAKGGSDYQTETGTLTFAEGETSKTISVSVNGDEDAEANETFSVILRDPSPNAELEKAQAQAVIRNDDELVVMPSSPETLFVGETTVRVVVNSIDRGLGVGIVLPPMPMRNSNPIENLTVTFSETDREIDGNFGYTGRSTDHSLVDIGVSPVPDGTIPVHLPVMKELREAAGDQQILLIQHLDMWVVLDSELKENTVVSNEVTEFSTSFGVSYEKDKVLGRTRAVNEAVLPELARAMTSSTLNALTGRIEEAFSGTASNKLAGQAVVSRPEEVRPYESYERPSLSWQEALGSSSFTVSLADGDNAFGDEEHSVSSPSSRKIAVWLQGDYRRLSGDSDEFMVDWNGHVIGGHLGADIQLGSGFLAGVATSLFKGSLDYTDRFENASIEGKHKSRMIGFHPYLGWSLSERLSLWSTVGWGFGKIEFEDEEIAGRQASDSGMKTMAAGGNLQLFSGGATTFNLKSEAWNTSMRVESNDDLIQDLKVGVNRLRLAFRGAHAFSLESGALTPSIELGARRDGGDGETGLGIELQGGIAYFAPAPGLTLEASGHTLLAHQGNLHDWGKICAIRFDPNSDRRGLSFSVLPSYGKISSGVEQLWESDVTDWNTTDHAASVRVDTEVGYGIPAFNGRGLVVPYGIFEPSGGDGRTYRLGSRFEIGSGLGLSLEGERRNPDMGDLEHGIMLRGQLNW